VRSPSPPDLCTERLDLEAPGRSGSLAGIQERDDTELVRAAQAGDRSALDRLLRAHVDRIHALCRRLCPGRADAEDATQDALMAVVRGLPRFDGRSSFATWSHRVATNACLDALRRQQRRPTVVRSIGPADEGDRGSRSTGSLDPADPGEGPDDQVPLRLAIDDALAELPEEFRVPVVLRDQLGMDYAEISDVLGIPPGTVRSRIARGRGRLAELLGPSGTLGDGNRSAGDDVQGSRP
jgi:RNA polymerase sigma-70 factor (ECF subfamily)